MGLSNESKNNTFVKLKIDKDTDTPFFYRMEKKGETWVETDTYTKAEGFLKGIKVETYTWEGKEKLSMKITLQDPNADGAIIISTGFNNMTRSMLNSIAGCTNLGLLELKATNWGKGEKKYATIFVQNNGQKTAWKFPMAELPQVEQVKNKKGEVVSVDDSEANDFFKNVINIDILPKITNEFEAEREMQKPKAKAPETINEPISDLPF
jgi:hypothetical protein